MGRNTLVIRHFQERFAALNGEWLPESTTLISTEEKRPKTL